MRFTFSNTCSSSVFAKATDFEREPTARTIFREYSRSERPSDAFWLKSDLALALARPLPFASDSDSEQEAAETSSRSLCA